MEGGIYSKMKAVFDWLNNTLVSKDTKQEKQNKSIRIITGRSTQKAKASEQNMVEEAETVEEFMSQLSDDILLDILSRLPIKTLKHCRLVCKHWHSIVHSPRFAQAHLHKASYRNSHIISLLIYDYIERPLQPHDFCLVEHEDNTYNYCIYGKDLHVHHEDDIRTYPKCLLLDYDDNDDNKDDDDDDDDNQNDLMALMMTYRENNDDVLTGLTSQFKGLSLTYPYSLVGSCNGLLCMSGPRHCDPVHVFNPLIGEYMTLPPSTKLTNHIVLSGFGFDSSTGKYKVLRMQLLWIDVTYRANPSFEMAGEVYTIGSGMWRSIGNVPYPLKGNPEFVNGALHWMSSHLVSKNFDGLIVSFDVAKEQFQVIPSPPGYHHGNRKNESRHLGKLGGCLCLFDCAPNDHLVIWVMKEYGVAESWTKEYVVERLWPDVGRLYFRPICMTKNEEILLLSEGQDLICYDPVIKGLRFLQIPGLPSFFNVITHVASLVSLRDAGESTSLQGNSVSYGRWSSNLCLFPSELQSEP